jgi:hypothetical protein
MNVTGKERLHSLLFGGEGELVNVKFFPGNGRGLTLDKLSGAAADMIQTAQSAWRDQVPSNPPVTGMEKRNLLG